MIPLVYVSHLCGFLQYEALDGQTEAQTHDDGQAGGVHRQEDQQLSHKAVWGARLQRCCLGHLAVDPCPALVALTGELVLHVQNVVVVEVAADMEAWPPRPGVAVDVEEARVEMQVGPRVQTLADALAVLLAQSFAAQLGSRRHINDIVAEGTVNVLLHRQTIPLQKDEVIQSVLT